MFFVSLGLSFGWASGRLLVGLADGLWPGVWWSSVWVNGGSFDRGPGGLPFRWARGFWPGGWWFSVSVGVGVFCSEVGWSSPLGGWESSV